LQIKQKEATIKWKNTEKALVSESSKALSYGVETEDCRVDDISVDRSAVEKLVESLNKYDASMAHIYEIIKNFLAKI